MILSTAPTAYHHNTSEETWWLGCPEVVSISSAKILTFVNLSKANPGLFSTSCPGLATMLGGVFLCISLASIFLCGGSLGSKAPSQVPFVPDENHRQISKQGHGLIRTMDSAPPHIGKQIPQDERDTWNVACNSELTKHECERIHDGSNTTFWQTKIDTQSVDPLPHSIVIDLREIKNVNAISMRPLPDADLGGAIAGHKVYLSVDEDDKKTWELVAFGTWFEDEQGGPLILQQLLWLQGL